MGQSELSGGPVTSQKGQQRALVTRTCAHSQPGDLGFLEKDLILEGQDPNTSSTQKEETSFKPSSDPYQ